MADSSLDDFFAKKDKSKKKSKTKSLIGDGDDVSKADKKVKKKKDRNRDANSSSQDASGVSNRKEDEEWKDFEEEKEVDYTGLRIQNMQIAKEEQDRDQGDGDDEEYNEDGEIIEKKDGASGPWNKGSEPTPAPVVVAAPEPVPEVDTTPKPAARYIPPSMRNQPASGGPSAFPSSRKKKGAPNLQSELDFPTLGGGPGPGNYSMYSNSASSDLIENPNARKGGNLTLENKFSALQD